MLQLVCWQCFEQLDKIIDALEGIKTSLHRKGLYVEDPEILRPVDKGWRNRNERIQAR
jgi:hypothetical protein